MPAGIDVMTWSQLDHVDRHIGRRIRVMRLQAGLPIKTLAYRIGAKNMQNIQRYETGTARITAANLWKIARALDVRLEWFFEEMPQGNENANLHKGT